MDRRQTINARILLAIVLGGAVALVFSVVGKVSLTYASEGASLQEQGDGLMKNVEEMVAHGGMGDASAIVHHCSEAARHAEGLLQQLSASDSRANQAMTFLNEVVRYCRRVSQIGRHADPGLLLNPAIKARAAARESVKVLGLIPAGKS